MSDVIATHAEQARVGVDRLYPVYCKEKNIIYKRIGFKPETTTQQYVRMYQEGGMPYATVVNEAGSIPIVSMFTGNNKDYYWVKRAFGYKCTYEKIETDQYGMADRTSNKMAIGMMKTKEATAAALFNNCTSTAAAYVGPDAVAFISASHPYNGGTFSNRGTGASNTDVDLSASALEDAIAKLRKTVDYEGIPDPKMGPFKLLVPVELEGLANRLTKEMSPRLPGGNDNDANWGGGLIAEVIANPWLTDTDAWFLISANADDHGLVEVKHGKPRAQKKIYEETEEVALFLSEKWLFHFQDARGVWGTVGA